ncbi:hypothetical protein BDN70DRAFT_940094 [Pholiota conissans]|uniref:Uncharacterized protein n=1 Tax=Pholiota conissans TaxID=109636 RepID=A0A9P5YJU8_9AGAR|nr:hypothetical protein BDN70DRAFT_940094 [Pholiota conissans]
MDSIARRRGWITYWLGCLSFAIAASLTVDGDLLNMEFVPVQDGSDSDFGSIMVSKWYQDLATMEFHQVFLSEMQSVAGIFQQTSQCVGAFVDILDKRCYSVDWFSKYCIPVWYPWTAIESEAAKRSSKIARLAPPVHLLQNISSFIVKLLAALDRNTHDLNYWRNAVKLDPTFRLKIIPSIFGVKSQTEPVSGSLFCLDIMNTNCTNSQLPARFTVPSSTSGTVGIC